MKKELTIADLKEEAKMFSIKISKTNHPSLTGVTDGKAVGTYIEHKFQEQLVEKYLVKIGNTGKGVDLPGDNIMTDIKTTSIKQPQSSCPFRSASQKIFGLGYNIIVFVYEKKDFEKTCFLNIVNCTFISKHRTGDYTTTKRLIEMIKDGANKEDIIGYLQDKNIPGDEITLDALANKILTKTIRQGYLTISNALQWRLQYKRVITLDNSIEGVENYNEKKGIR